MGKTQTRWKTSRTGKPRPPTQDPNSRLDVTDWFDRRPRYQKRGGRRR